MTTLTDRERELVEAAKDVFRYSSNGMMSPGDMVPHDMLTRMFKAIRAYDPPKRKYTMPTWEELCAKGVKPYQDHICIEVNTNGDKVGISKVQFEAIREALSTEQE